MANLKGKIESEVEIKSSSEKYYNFFKTPHHVPNVAGDHIQGVDMHEGDWDSHGHGSVKIWQYTAGMYAKPWSSQKFKLIRGDRPTIILYLNTLNSHV